CRVGWCDAGCQWWGGAGDGCLVLPRGSARHNHWRDRFAAWRHHRWAGGGTCRVTDVGVPADLRPVVGAELRERCAVPGHDPGLARAPLRNLRHEGGATAVTDTSTPPPAGTRVKHSEADAARRLTG